MFNPSRDEARRFFNESWRKRCEKLPATPMEILVADVIEAHPEYHHIFTAGDTHVDRDWTPEGGETNPFLHIGLHVSVREQLQVDQPPGIRAAHAAITLRTGDPLSADHAVMDCLAEQIWQMQKNGIPFENTRYLNCITSQRK
jgi:Domain of unknown function (DUF1841)